MLTSEGVEDFKKLYFKEYGIRLSDDQVKNLLARIDLLLDGWMEIYERGIFEGKTLNEMLNNQNES